MTEPLEQSETLREMAERIVIEGTDATGTVFPARMASAIEAALKAERERNCRLLCKWCGDVNYNLIWHHEQWRHYRLPDMHVEYCDAAVLRGRGNNHAD